MNDVYFSIITINLNSNKGLLNTVNSVLNQKYQKYQLIIKDGGSGDESLELIKPIAYSRPNVLIIKEQDHGIYNAMNIAERFITGQYVCFLNSGDTFVNDMVLCNINLYLKHTVTGVLYGNYINKNGNLCIMPKKIGKIYFYKRFLCHQTVFYNKNILIPYDEHLKLLADHDLHLNLLKHKINFHNSNLIICNYEGGGISEKNIRQHHKEQKILQKKYYNTFERIYCSAFYYASFPHIRFLLSSAKAPKFIRLFYYSLVKIIRTMQ